MSILIKDMNKPNSCLECPFFNDDTNYCSVLQYALRSDQVILNTSPCPIECVEYDEPSAQQWIPCSERLPEENGQYLITVKYVHVDGYDDIYAEHGEWMDGKWDMFCFGHCGQVEKILAWMPLPEPWKGEKG